MLGGTSKQERDLIRVRVRDGMTVLAETSGRHLGGRSPYGYRLADAGEHPNAKSVLWAKAHGTLRYRCITTQTRALPLYLSHHPKAVYVREDAIVNALDAWLPTLADPEWLASTQEPEPSIAKRHASLRARLTEIDKATTNLVKAIEAGTDAAVINPRLADLRAEREAVTRQLASLQAPERLSPMDIDALLAELGGLGSVLSEATPPEKASIYRDLGLQLVYHPADKAVVATADLGRVLSRVGGGT